MTINKIKEYAYKIYSNEHRTSDYNDYTNFCKKVWKDEKMRKHYCSLIITELLNSVEDVIYLGLDKSKYASIIKVIRQIKEIMLENTTE